MTEHPHHHDQAGDGHDHGHDDHGLDDHGHHQGRDQGAHDGHAHHHQHHHHRALGRKALGFSLLLTGTFCVAEGAAGFLTGSLALISDATHMLTDTLGLAVAFAAATLGARKIGGRSTFGLRRLPVLGGLFNAMLVLAASGIIVVEAVERIQSPRSIAGAPVVAVAFMGLLVNLLGAWWVHRSGDKSVNVRGAMLHMMGDALGSVAALVAGVALALGASGVVDPIASLVVAGIIAVGAIRLITDAGSILLERAPAHIDVGAVQELAKASPGVAEVVGLHAWELDSGEAVASLVLVTPETDLVRLAAFADEIKRSLLEKFHIHHATIEWRPTESPRPCCE